VAFTGLHGSTFAQVVPQEAVVLVAVSQPSVATPLQSSLLEAHAVQTPPEHVWLVVQATPVPQVPDVLQVWTVSPEHCVVP